MSHIGHKLGPSTMVILMQIGRIILSVEIPVRMPPKACGLDLLNTDWQHTNHINPPSHAPSSFGCHRICGLNRNPESTSRAELLLLTHCEVIHISMSRLKLEARWRSIPLKFPWLFVFELPWCCNTSLMLAIRVGTSPTVTREPSDYCICAD